MGFAAAATAKQNSHTSSSKENRGMGMSLILVFFPQHHNKMTNSIDNNTASRFIRRTSSSLLFSKAQATISICALLVFLTLLLFTLSTFEPSIPTPTPYTPSSSSTIKNSRRFLSQKSQLSSSSSFRWFFPMLDYKLLYFKQKSIISPSSFALQGMGTLYRRGTKAMNDLIVSHVVEDVTEHELRLFLRVLHRSSVTSKADTVFLFGSSSLSSRFSFVIQEENESFLKLIQYYKELNITDFRDSIFSFNPTQFWKSWKKVVGEPIWGKKGRGNYSNSTEAEDESTRLTYGSVLGFDVNELDPENSLAGFLDHVPMSLRRWACYPMLLGRVRRNFKHIMFLDVKKMMTLSDPLVRVRNRSPDSVYILTKESSSGKRKRTLGKTRSHFQVNSAILMGGAKGIRRLSNAMLTEIVRATMQHKKKKKNSISESEILSQLVGNGYILQNVNLITWTSTESIQEASSLTGLSTNSAASYSIIQPGNRNHYLNSIIMKLICLCEVNSSIYSDC